jgi:hypothetical protein
VAASETIKARIEGEQLNILFEEAPYPSDDEEEIET